MKHLVNSLKFDLRCPQEAQAFTLRQEVMEELQPLIAGSIESVWDALVPGDECLQIDRLEIDLGKMTADTLKEQFAPKFRQQLEQKLLEHISRLPEPGSPGPSADPDLQLFFHFMKTGRLPWWAVGTEPDFEQICAQIIARTPEAVITFFLQQGKSKYIWSRVVKQLDYRFQEFLLSVLEPFKEARLQLEYFIAKLKPQLQQSSDPAVGPVLDELQKMAQDSRITLLRQGPELFKAGRSPAIKDAVAAFIIRALFGAEHAERAALYTQVQKLLNEQGQVIKPKAASAEEAGTEQIPGEAPAAPEKIMIQDAGLVLLGPYLKPFFTALGLWQDQQWAGPDAQEKAACLLRRIATGQNAEQEYDLVLEKILCGIPWYQPVYSGFEFTAEEIKESETLLESVIAHWQALKNTSVEGFRSSFLLREAVLASKEEHWQLTVERKTLDVLLESIPWGYGTLCLPWNEYLIFTEW